MIVSPIKMYYKKIPSFHINSIFKKSELIAPPGINMSELTNIIAARVASTILHEARHGKEWAERFLSNKEKLNNLDRSKEESLAEEEERKIIVPDINNNIFDNSQDSATLSDDQVLHNAIDIANANTDINIPYNLVEMVDLGAGIAGQFEMTQGPGLDTSDLTPHIAWSNNDQKLLIDVRAMIKILNNEVANEKQNHDTKMYHDIMTGKIPTGTKMPTTFQQDSFPDVPGVSQSTPSIPSAPSVPSI